MKKGAKMEWIKVEDDLPEEKEIDFNNRAYSESVLVTNMDCVIIAIYSDGEWCFEDEYEGLQESWISKDVTHWQPLPPPPSSHNSN